jgi:iron(III) transport system ATP-binding protein
MSSIDITGLTLRFADEPVLQDLDLHVRASTVTAILGSSGSGKSTLLRCVAGLLRPEAGTITIGPTAVFGKGTWVPPERRGIGLVPQEGSLFPHLSVGDNVGYGLRGRANTERVTSLLDLVGLPGTAAMRPHELSGGMQQRVAVARALAPSPNVVLLDEPFSALDAGLRDDVRQDVFAAIRATGATAILVTHDQQEAFAVADQVAVMMDATIVQQAPPAEVYLTPASLDVAQFVGDTVVVEAHGTGDHRARTAFGDLAALERTETGAAGVLVFRPEDLQITGDGPLLTQAAVSSVSYHGHDTLLRARAGDQDLEIRVLGRQSVSVGDEVTVRVTRPGIFFS